MGGVNAQTAPLHRILNRSANLAQAGGPPNAAPNIDFLGAGIQDHRLPYNSRGSSALQPGILGWYGGTSFIETCDYVPSEAATANIAALAHVVSGTPMTLVSSSGSGAIVLSESAPAFFPLTGLSLDSGVAIDSLPLVKAFGAGGQSSGFNTAFYDPATCVGRGVSISGVSGGSGGNFLVEGYDIYGEPMSQLITVAAGANTVDSLKTFKVVESVTPQFSDAHNYSVGTADVYGFGIYAARLEKVLVYNNGTLETALSTNFIAPVNTTPSDTTGDVRGTYNGFSSDGTKRLVMFVSPSIAALASNYTTGLFGQTQA